VSERSQQNRDGEPIVDEAGKASVRAEEPRPFAIPTSSLHPQPIQDWEQGRRGVWNQWGVHLRRPHRLPHASHQVQGEYARSNGAPRQGKGGLEENVSGREEGLVPSKFLSNLLRDEGTQRRVEEYYGVCPGIRRPQLVVLLVG